jgi:hypothetical protein
MEADKDDTTRHMGNVLRRFGRHFIFLRTFGDCFFGTPLLGDLLLEDLWFLFLMSIVVTSRLGIVTNRLLLFSSTRCFLLLMVVSIVVRLGRSLHVAIRKREGELGETSKCRNVETSKRPDVEASETRC